MALLINIHHNEEGVYMSYAEHYITETGGQYLDIKADMRT